jgi:xanthine/uracil permease
VVPDLFAQLPNALRVIVSDGVITGSLAAILLNLFFNAAIERKVPSVSLEKTDYSEIK